MSLVSEIGNTVLGEVHVEWSLSDFFSLSGKVDNYYNSPPFSFAGEQWYLQLYPNGESRNASSEWVGLYLYKNFFAPKTVYYTFGIKGSDGVEEDKERVSEFSGKNPSWGCSKLWSRSKLRSRKSTLLPNNVLTVTCDLRNKALSVDKGKKRLNESLLGMLESGDDSDVVIKVQGKEFPAHKGILRARSAVFRSMFTHDMLERQSNVVTIEDGDAETFGDFLVHIYSGSCEQISTENVYSLYAAADKYDVCELREACVEFMKRNITVACFCDVITLAKKHEDEKLEECATNFFCDNSVEIVKTGEWLNFQKENLALGNELFIKAMSK